MIFLMNFDPKRRRLHAMKVFQDQQRPLAQDERLNWELQHLRAGDEREIVLLTAVDEDTLRRTHARYFAAASLLTN
ncbi:MAG TPA: hypothetical protein VGE36_15425 [Roseateles sp.]